MNKDAINHENHESHENHDRNHEKESGKSHERIHEIHEKGHENHDRNHEKESAPSLPPPSSRYTIDSPLPSSRYTISSPPPPSRHTTSLPLQHAPSLSRQSIFSSNINLVHGVVAKYKIRDSYVREEAVSVGMEELWNCTERWKEEKGKFSTYAWRCVDGKVIVKKSIKS